MEPSAGRRKTKKGPIAKAQQRPVERQPATETFELTAEAMPRLEAAAPPMNGVNAIAAAGNALQPGQVDRQMLQRLIEGIKLL